MNTDGLATSSAILIILAGCLVVGGAWGNNLGVMWTGVFISAVAAAVMALVLIVEYRRRHRQ